MKNENNKKEGERPEAEIIAIDTNDVIVTSGEGDPELPIEEF